MLHSAILSMQHVLEFAYGIKRMNVSHLSSHYRSVISKLRTSANCQSFIFYTLYTLYEEKIFVFIITSQNSILKLGDS